MRRLFLICLITTPLACAADEPGLSGPPISDEQSAAEGFEALTNVLSAIGMSPPAGQQRTADEAITFRDTAHDIDVTVDCPSGGKMAVQGTFTQGGDPGAGYDPENPEAGVAIDIAFEYRMSFDSCSAGDVSIDGALNYAFDVEVDSASGVYAYNFSFNGEVGFTGAVEGTCSIDATGSASSESPSEMTYEGTICGFEASELDV